MKCTVKSILSILLVLIIVLSVSACGKDATKGNETGVNDDFFTDDVESAIDNGNSDAGTADGGASSDQSSTSANASTPTENAVGGKSWEEVLKSMPKSLRGSTVTVMNWNPMSEYTGAADAIKEFQKQTGINVKWQTVAYSVYITRLASFVASNTAPDVVRTRTPVPERMVSFQSLDACKYDFTDEAWDQVLMKDYTINGVTYATSLKNTHIGSVMMMFYNKDLISKYDYEDPYTLWKNGKWTWSKFIDMGKEYMKESNAINGCVGGTWDTFTQSFGIPGPVGYDGNQYYSLINDSKFLTVTQEIANLYNVDKLLHMGRAEVFDAGECLFYAGGSVYLRRNNSYFGQLKSSGTLYAVPMPKIDGQDTYYQARDEYEAYAVPQGAKNPEAVPYFLRYFLDGENYDLTSFFCNKQNLEVYNWCMSQKNTIWTTYYTDTSDKFASGLTVLQGSQIKSYIDSNSYMIDERVKNYNKLLTQLKK